MGPGCTAEVGRPDTAGAGDAPMVGPVVLGIDFGGTKVALAVADLNGQRLGVSVVPTRPEEGGRAALARAVDAGRLLLARVGAEGTLAAVGVSTIGIPWPNRVDLAPAIPGWGSLALQPSLQDAFAVPVRVGTDVKLAAASEARWGTLEGADPAIYVNLGTGLAVAIVAGGEVLAGAHGASGEIGYNLTELAQVGRPVGHRRMLEDTVSGMGLAAAGTTLLGRPVTAEDVFAADGASSLTELVDDFLAQLSLHLVNLVIAIDPQRVAVGGGMARSWPRLYPALEQALKSGVPFPPELVRAAHSDASLMGALSLALEAAGAAPLGYSHWRATIRAGSPPGPARP
jgi:predicted NBD/HSP70 family sugar kinase